MHQVNTLAKNTGNKADWIVDSRASIRWAVVPLGHQRGKWPEFSGRFFSNAQIEEMKHSSKFLLMKNVLFCKEFSHSVISLNQLCKQDKLVTSLLSIKDKNCNTYMQTKRWTSLSKQWN